MRWPLVAVAEVARVVGGATPKTGTAEFWNGNINWATPKDLSDLGGKFISETPRKITEPGLKGCAAEIIPANSVLFSSRAPIGHVAINTVPMATNQGFKSFIPGPRLDSGFLYWWLDAHRESLQAMGTGATFKEVSKATVERIEIPLPPLEEQKRIAAILDQADALRRLRRRALDRLNTLGQAIFDDIQFLATETAEIHSIGDLCDLVRGSSPRPQGDPRFFGGPVPRLMIADITRDGMEVTPSIDSLTVEGAKKSRPMAAGEVVMAVSGAVGLPAVLQTDACIHDGFVGFRRLDERVRPKYLYHVLLSQMASNKAKGTGAIWSNLTTDYVKNILISVPTLEEQDRMLSKIGVILTQKKAAARDLDMLDTLFTSLQHRAFRGEL